MEHHPTPESDAPRSSVNDMPAAPSRVNRRALLRAGTAAAPVLLTLASGPVGATGLCTVASSFVSAATFASRHGTMTPCVTKHCNYWNGQAQVYPNCDSGATKTALDQTVVYYHAGANITPPCTTTTTCQTHFQTLAPSGPTCVLQHMTALKLGAATMPSTSYLADMWNAYKASSAPSSTTGTFTFSNVTWTEAQLIDWLKKIQGL